ncbi:MULTISPECIES: CHAD domain-containing protein [unclassified Caballeronia]|uniref:CHAD domain-containing protein n=1 Tax=unclassified Caballeronia TaxID=2646786 RepID=UPI00285CF8E6|nr:MULTISPECIES: CHAD domain-containing protein [unclassified Caballeronia]MDR5755013.1 CHAD domain-containing protein [Caballeronia sp. LZ024]MDR5845575.1 CHAD domain-containing protein [Caballeronia sp. LZ031]
MKTEQTNNAAGREQLAETNFATFADPLVNEAIEGASALKDTADAEKLHKLRVALRRLRTLLWAYRPILDEKFDNKQRALFKFFANAAGNTRDWDILISLVEKDSGEALLGAMQKHRDETARKSSETLSNSKLEKTLHDAIHEANRELNTAPARTPLSVFAQKRVLAAQKQLKKRMHHAAKAGGSDYSSYHDVRKAGKKVRYLIEFFEPLLEKKQRKGVKRLKRLQKQFGALNDVVASRDLLSSHRSAFPEGVNAEQALRSLKKEQKRRIKSAAKLL